MNSTPSGENTGQSGGELAALLDPLPTYMVEHLELAERDALDDRRSRRAGWLRRVLFWVPQKKTGVAP